MQTAIARRIVLAGIAAATFGAQAATAAASDRGDDPVAAATAAYRAAYPQLSVAAARAAAAAAGARREVYDAAARDARSYGGAWFDPVAGVVRIAATSRAAVARATALGRRHGVVVDARRVRRSFAQLERQAAGLRAGQGAIGQAADGQVGIDVKANAVVAAVPRARRAVLQDSAAAGGVKLVDDPGVDAESDAGCASRLACDATIRAGAVMWYGEPPLPWCSVGFTARDADGQRFVYTAGHCNTGIGVGWGTGEAAIGPLSASLDTGAIDAAIIQVTNPLYADGAGGEIFVEDGDGRTAPVTGVARTLDDIVAGETVCLAANFSAPNGGNDCGIVATNSDATVRGMVRVDGVDTCGGDSGGGWYWLTPSGDRVAYGIHSRSDDGCHGDRGGSHSWFSALPTVKSGFAPGLDVELAA